MDPTAALASLPAEVTTLLATIEALPEKTKAAALQHIATKLKLKTADSVGLENESHDEPEPGTSTHINAHSCHICKQFAMTKRLLEDLEPDEAPQFVYRSKVITLTKETLRQGLAHNCVLVEWIYRLLAQDLRAFESDLAKRVNLAELTSRGTTDHLQFISTQGVTADFRSRNWDFDETTLRMNYEAEPYLVDKLWNVAYELRHGNSYEMFERKYRSFVDSSFRVFSAPDNSAASEVYGRPARKIMDREASLELASSFLDKCQNEHEKCSRTASVLPSRVIDVGKRFPIRWVKLHWSEDNETGKYAALSYCWGGLQPIITTSQTAQDHTDGIQFSRLPKTLQDAMVVTHRLGLRYLWIDSLCILQDDPLDLSREIANMANIFQGAFVTISAASSASVQAGFLDHCQSRSNEIISLPYQSSTVKDGAVLIEQERSVYDPAEDPINLRAWTLQEHILPRRTLMFGTKELWWTCEREVNFGDPTLSTRRKNRVPGIHSKSGDNRYSLDYWRLIVRDYTRRFLTYPNDKLSAIAGVANIYAQFFESRYLAGLWEYSLASELMWCSTRSDISRPLSQRAPSWSWASVDGEVHHNWCTHDSGLGMFSIIECHVTPVSDSSPFGPVIADRCGLRIRGLLIEVRWELDRTYICQVASRKRQRPDFSGVESSEIVSRVGRTQADALEENLPETVWVLPITKDPMRGLLLEHLYGETYRRVGLVLRLWKEDMVDEASLPQTILIV